MPPRSSSARRPTGRARRPGSGTGRSAGSQRGSASSSPTPTWPSRPAAPPLPWPCRTATGSRLIIADPAAPAGRLGRAPAARLRRAGGLDRRRPGRAGRRTRRRRRVADLGQAARRRRPRTRSWRGPRPDGAGCGWSTRRPGPRRRSARTAWPSGSSRRSPAAARSWSASDDPTEAGWYHSSLIMLDAGGARARVLRESPWQLSSPAVSPDGRSVAYVEGWASDRGLLAGEVFSCARLRRTTRPRRHGPLDADVDVTWLSWAADERAVAGRLAAPRDGLGLGRRPACWPPRRRRPERMARGGAGGVAPRISRHVEAASCLNSSLAPRGRPAGRRLGADHALDTRCCRPRWCGCAAAARPPPWTALNARPRWLARTARDASCAGTRRTGPRSRASWPSRPPAGGSATTARPRPLVVDIHGGPSLAWHHSWDLRWAELLTAAGYAVLMPNPRGSAGAASVSPGPTWPIRPVPSSTTSWPGWRAASPTAVPTRTGWRPSAASYGGYLTAWAIAGGGGVPLRRRHRRDE